MNPSSPPRKIKPFAEQGNFTAMHNVCFDRIMRELSGPAWKVLCVILRRTKGWGKKSDSISFVQFKELTGIRSNVTVTEALDELLDAKTFGCALIEMRRGEATGATSHKPNRYCIHRDFEMDELPPHGSVDIDTTSVKKPRRVRRSDKKKSQNALDNEVPGNDPDEENNDPHASENEPPPAPPDGSGNSPHGAQNRPFIDPGEGEDGLKYSPLHGPLNNPPTDHLMDTQKREEMETNSLLLRVDNDKAHHNSRIDRGEISFQNSRSLGTVVRSEVRTEVAAEVPASRRSAPAQTPVADSGTGSEWVLRPTPDGVDDLALMEICGVRTSALKWHDVTNWPDARSAVYESLPDFEPQGRVTVIRAFGAWMADRNMASGRGRIVYLSNVRYHFAQFAARWWEAQEFEVPDQSAEPLSTYEMMAKLRGNSGGNGGR